MTRNSKPRDSRRSRGSSSDSSPKLAKLKFAPPRLSREQILHRGQDAAQTLGSPVFLTAYRSVLDDLENERYETEPHESQKREWLHWQAMALGQVMDKLQEFVSDAQSVRQEIEAAEKHQQLTDAEELGYGDPLIAGVLRPPREL